MRRRDVFHDGAHAGAVFSPAPGQKGLGANGREGSPPDRVAALGGRSLLIVGSINVEEGTIAQAAERERVKQLKPEILRRSCRTIIAVR
jgi:hypothetical protein